MVMEGKAVKYFTQNESILLMFHLKFWGFSEKAGLIILMFPLLPNILTSVIGKD